MKQKLFLWWGLAFLAISCVSASVVINQVLYNPEFTESGGEAVELYNNASSDSDISGWVIATEASMNDAVIPENTVLCPGCYYLVADTGWNDSKDNSSWANADFEELINLYNTNSGVALMDGDDVVDAVGWGDPDSINEGLYEGTPADSAAEGNSLLRTGDTDNNQDDFTESYPNFRSSSNTGGGSCSAEADIEFEIDSEPKIVNISISPSKVDFGRIMTEKDYEGEIDVANTGNTAVDLGVKCTSFGSISSSSLKYSFSTSFSTCASNTVIKDVNLSSNSTITLKIRLNTPNNSTTGKYAGKITISAVES
jgi:hypothetical protein